MDRASAIIVKNTQILMIYRKHDGEIYYSFPGGKIEMEETPEQAVEREVKEETNLDVTKSDYLFSIEEDVVEDKRKNYFYACKVTGGEPKLNGPELEQSSEINYYEPMWITLEQLNTSELGASPQAKNRIKQYLHLS